MRKVLFILGELADEDVEWMARTGSRRRLKIGEAIIRQGQPGSALYFVLTGQFGVYASDREVAQLGSGEIVGEMSFIDRRPPSATVRALEESTVLALDTAAMASRLQQDAGFSGRFYRALATFLSDRLRTNLAAQAGATTHETGDLDELDLESLDRVSQAGARFDRLMGQLRAG